jgi:tol-pal system protein YbgF
MKAGLLWAVALGAFVTLGACDAALAEKKPKDPVEERFEKLEKDLKQLRSIVTQARESGQPVQVRIVTDPDPAVEALQQRIDDLEGAARTRNEQIDSLTRDLEQAKKEAADAQGQAKALDDRLAKLEAQVKTLQAAPPPTSAPAAAAPGPGAGADAAPGDAESAFAKAKQLLLDGQYAAAGGAFQAFVDAYGDTDHGPEARYWLGETLFIRGMYPDAATAYIGAIRGWPQSPWAPDAVLKLARSLVEMQKAPEACRTLDELGKRYPDAPRAIKTRAGEVRVKAACTAEAEKAPAKKPANAERRRR